MSVLIFRIGNRIQKIFKYYPLYNMGQGPGHWVIYESPPSFRTPTRWASFRPLPGEAPALKGPESQPQRAPQSSPCWVTTHQRALPWSCRGWPAVSCRSWLCDKVNLLPWNCSVTGVSGWATRLGGPAREASWAILTTSPPAEMQTKWEWTFFGRVGDCYTDNHLSQRMTVCSKLKCHRNVH